MRNALRFGRSRSSSVEEDERALVMGSNPAIALAAAASAGGGAGNATTVSTSAGGSDDQQQGAYGSRALRKKLRKNKEVDLEAGGADDEALLLDGDGDPGGGYRRGRRDTAWKRIGTKVGIHRGSASHQGDDAKHDRGNRKRR